ncbi:MAG: hypothetical protein RMJ67_05960 [Elusimicrobiota bacterium]|nr:hypothetical protein [Endomicrobiia bacterium]MDW8166037.1 hypothetical protein [Elusimicrobiota bacterium]
MAYKKVSIARRFVKFEKFGDYVEGYLDRIEKSKIFDREVERGVLIDDDNNELYLPSNFQITEFCKKMLSEGFKLCKVKIVYVGNEKTRLGRGVKVYEFYIDTETRKALN